MEVEEAASSNDVHIEEPKDVENDLSLKDHLLGQLDQVEAHVEELRKMASQLENEKDQILTTIHTLKNMDSLNDIGDSKFAMNLINDKVHIEPYVRNMLSSFALPFQDTG